MIDYRKGIWIIFQERTVNHKTSGGLYLERLCKSMDGEQHEYGEMFPPFT